MRILCLPLFLCTLAAQPNLLNPAEQAEGFRLLFDGTTLRHWKDVRRMTPPGDSFAIEDGAIKVNAHPRFREDLYSARNYRNFELRFDWKISPGGNSGLKYVIQDIAYMHPQFIPDTLTRFEKRVDHALTTREGKRARIPVDGKGEIYSVGFEYQVIDNEAHSDALRSRKSWAASLYQMVASDDGVFRKAGEWNEARLIVRNDAVEHWLNGRMVMKASLNDEAVRAALEARWTKDSPVYRLLTQRPRKAAPLIIQNHNDAAWFRNLRIRELP
jgi:hypothetical protein